MGNEYVRLSWPEYQEYMEHPEWRTKASMTMDNSGDWLIPSEWLDGNWTPMTEEEIEAQDNE